MKNMWFQKKAEQAKQYSQEKNHREFYATLKGHRQPQVFAGVQAIGAIFCNTETSIS